MPRSRCFHTRCLPHVILACRSRADFSSQSRYERTKLACRTGTTIDHSKIMDAHECAHVNGAISGELFFSINVDAGVQRQMI